MSYPLYDVPYLVREYNEAYMSEQRHLIELRNQAVVDDYFLARDKGLSPHNAKELIAQKHRITPKRLCDILTWFYREAKKRGKDDFLEKFKDF